MEVIIRVDVGLKVVQFFTEHVLYTRPDIKYAISSGQKGEVHYDTTSCQDISVQFCISRGVTIIVQSLSFIIYFSL